MLEGKEGFLGDNNDRQCLLWLNWLCVTGDEDPTRHGTWADKQSLVWP